MRIKRRMTRLPALFALGFMASAAAAQPAVPPPASAPSPAPPPPAAAPITTSSGLVLAVRARPAVAVPLFDLAYLITARDYPEKARRKRWEGEVSFVLAVGSDGLVTGCDISQSSGHAELDEATCRLASQRARFEPAVDAGGNRTAGSYLGRVVWDRSKSRDTPLAGTITRQFRVDEEGRVSRCRIIKVTGPVARLVKPGSDACRHTAFIPDHEPDMPRKAKIVTEVDTIVVTPVSEP